ncbi:MAG: hypothetical protein AAFQ81_14560 [Pseudomonadota bacterium]
MLRILLPCLLILTVLPWPAAASEFAPGEKFATYVCGRCHVVSERTRMGGIGSTPSFMALRGFPDWEERFRVFYALMPHPSFTQVEGITPPFPPERPPHIHPVELTEADLERLVEYVRALEPLDLGGTIGGGFFSEEGN